MERGVVSFREVASGLRSLGIERHRPVIAHASLSAFGEVSGGAASLLGALLAISEQVMMPVFTYKTMLTPESGPPDNGLVYGSQRDQNRMAEFFHPNMPADRLMGTTAETLRRHPLAWRSRHPILSFAGIGLESILEKQTLDEPLAPIGELVDAGGYVLLMGVDHTVNTGIHYAERLAGRLQFVRWALADSGVVECRGYPGCSQGFQAIAADLTDVTTRSIVGKATVQALPLQALVERVRQRLEKDPLALLCASSHCLMCQAVRIGIMAQRE
jgi:aminoglycoside 3-N-acetyltransferase